MAYQQHKNEFWRPIEFNHARLLTRSIETEKQAEPAVVIAPKLASIKVWRISGGWRGNITIDSRPAPQRSTAEILQ